MKFNKTAPTEMLLNSLLLKDYSTLSKFLTQNQVLKKPVKLLNSQNVNCWSRCEFIRLRIQYGTEISFEIEYHSIIYRSNKKPFLFGMVFSFVTRLVLGEARLSAVSFFMSLRIYGSLTTRIGTILKESLEWWII